MNCSACGVEVAEGSVYCHACGERLTEAHPPQPADPAEAGSPSPHPSEQVAQQQTPSQQFQANTNSHNSHREIAEEVLWEGGYSARAMTGYAVGAGLITVAAVILAIMLSFKSLGWTITISGCLLLWGALLLVLLYRQWSVDYKLTNQRLVHRSGLLTRKTDRIEVIDMDDVNFTQGIVERLLNIGTIVIVSSDKSHPQLELIGIERCEEIATLMDNARRAERERRGLYIESI